MAEITFSDEFGKEFSKIKDRALRLRILNALKRLASDPEKGKPLRYGYKGNRRLRVDPFRILYAVEGNKIKISYFEHREKIYK